MTFSSYLRPTGLGKDAPAMLMPSSPNKKISILHPDQRASKKQLVFKDFTVFLY